MIVYWSVRSKKVELKKKVERYAKDGEQGESDADSAEWDRAGRIRARDEMWTVRVCIRSSNRMILFQGKVGKQVVVYMHSLND